METIKEEKEEIKQKKLGNKGVDRGR